MRYLNGWHPFDLVKITMWRCPILQILGATKTASTKTKSNSKSLYCMDNSNIGFIENCQDPTKHSDIKIACPNSSISHFKQIHVIKRFFICQTSIPQVRLAIGLFIK